MSSLNFEKLKIIVQNLHQNVDDYDVFVETGTLVGDTTINLQSILMRFTLLNYQKSILIFLLRGLRV